MTVRFPKPLFTRSELRYHLLLMPVLFSAGNYLFLGERYFTDPAVFGWGTLLVFGLYWFSLIILTTVIKLIIQCYPDARQVQKRTLMALLAVTTLTVGLALLDVWAYSLFSVFERPFTWNTVRAIVGLGFLFDVLLCLMLGIQYTYGRWQENQIEKEQLKRMALEQDFDALKQQINPHFLFNSLTSLSALIGHDTKQAGVFVNHLSQVYRYQLSVFSQLLISLEAELSFLNSYGYLLNIRYQSAISLQIEVSPDQRPANLPPLSLQLMLDYAIRHNVVSKQKPLLISIRTIQVASLQIQYKRQPRSVRVNPVTDELAILLARYKMLPVTRVTVSDTDQYFTIILPLVTENIIDIA